MEYYDDNDQQHNQTERFSRASKGPIYKPSNTPQNRPENSPMAKASLLCGILGCLFLCLFQFPTAIFLGVAAISLSLLSRQGKPLASMAIGGFICGIFALALGLLIFYCVIVTNNMLRNPEMAQLLDQLLEQYGYSFPQ